MPRLHARELQRDWNQLSDWLLSGASDVELDHGTFVVTDDMCRDRTIFELIDRMGLTVTVSVPEHEEARMYVDGKLRQECRRKYPGERFANIEIAFHSMKTGGEDPYLELDMYYRVGELDMYYRVGEMAIHYRRNNFSAAGTRGGEKLTVLDGKLCRLDTDGTIKPTFGHRQSPYLFTPSRTTG